MLIATDPGKMSGIAWLWTGEMPQGEEDREPFSSLELDTWESVGWIANYLSHPRYEIEAVVCESYLITQQTLRKTRGENWSLEVIGATRWLCLEAGVPFILQTPADAKRFSTDVKLKRVGWWNPTTGGHANDASRHLLLYLARSGRLPDTLVGGEGGTSSPAQP